MGSQPQNNWVLLTCFHLGLKLGAFLFCKVITAHNAKKCKSGHLFIPAFLSKIVPCSAASMALVHLGFDFWAVPSGNIFPDMWP
jgi:hypothetical protein